RLVPGIVPHEVDRAVDGLLRLLPNRLYLLGWLRPKLSEVPKPALSCPNRNQRPDQESRVKLVVQVSVFVHRILELVRDCAGEPQGQLGQDKLGCAEPGACRVNPDEQLSDLLVIVVPEDLDGELVLTDLPKSL